MRPNHADGDERVDEMAPSVCHFCGAETRDGLMVWPTYPIPEPYWPICAPCMRLALSDGRRVRYQRSPN